MLKQKKYFEILLDDFNAHQRKINLYLQQKSFTLYKAWYRQQDKNTKKMPLEILMLKAFTDFVEENHKILQKMEEQYQLFNKEYNLCLTEQQQQDCIINYCQILGASKRDIARDIKAFRRYFDYGAVMDRYQKKKGQLELESHFFLDRIPNILSKVSTTEREELFQQVFLNIKFGYFLYYVSNYRLQAKAIEGLGKSVKLCSAKSFLKDETIHFLHYLALSRQENIWLQIQAIHALAFINLSSAERIIINRLSKPGDGDDFFVRMAMIDILISEFEHIFVDTKGVVYDLLLQEPSESVRQKCSEIIPYIDNVNFEEFTTKFILEETFPTVKSAFIMKLLGCLEDNTTFVLNTIQKILEREEDTFVLRTALHFIEKSSQLLYERNDSYAQQWLEECMLAIDGLILKTNHTYVKRWCTKTQEFLWCLSDSKIYNLFCQLQKKFSHIRAGKSKLYWRYSLSKYNHAKLGRVIAIITRNDFNYELHWGVFFVKVTRGHQFKTRLWRIWHEYQTPAPDKRQGFRHTVGRVSKASFRVPSSINAEMTETKIPGEPLFIDDEQGWRPFIPLLDDVIASLDLFTIFPKKIRIYSSEGVTEIKPPWFWGQRLWAYFKITKNFSEYATLRNWKENMQAPPTQYLKKLTSLGIKFSFQPHHKSTKELNIAHFFPCFLVIDPIIWKNIMDSLESLRQYFFSAYSNSVFDLTVFLVFFVSLFFGLHIYRNYLIRKARRKIPFIIGGWGTRGKSGTERVKASLINALGYPIVSKTTGCEAMFLYSLPFGSTHEIFLFRPYDKATIWEQYNLVRLASELDTHVFLWECMALNPAYVKVLQQNWMHDDLSTITNTYPDHEDVQGPSGLNVAETIATFTPLKSQMIISEEQMSPILEEQAYLNKTVCQKIDWLKAGSIPSDVVKRFPYNEHPYNIALVLKIAEELNIPYIYAIKEMADRVIADLGVLKIYPPAQVKERTLEFTNGMSANERLGCLGNWKRLRLFEQNIYEKPGVWLTTVVNNRADRIPRSKVFARILVRDLNADKHFLIGGNLAGLMAYIEEEWEEYVCEIKLFSDQKQSCEYALKILEESAKKLRIPYQKEHVFDRLEVMITENLRLYEIDDPALEKKINETQENAKDILKFHKENVSAYSNYLKIQNEIQKASDFTSPQLHKKLYDQLFKWFKAKLVIIENYYATGDEVIHTIARATPPKVYNKIMGLQNIKGTGLDFVYRWQAWQNCYDLCNNLTSQNEKLQEDALRELVNFYEYGLLSEEHVQKSVAESNKMRNTQFWEDRTKVIIQNLNKQISNIKTLIENSDAQKTNNSNILLRLLESFLDTQDAVRRRKKANIIYQDLKAQRISIQRAILELQKLTKRQKGGWLSQK